MNHTATETSTDNDKAHWAWRPVVTFVLALVAWSVYTYLHDYVHVPKLLALGGAAIFDLTALVLGDLSHRAIKAGDVAAANIYRLGVAAFVAASSTVNWLHAKVAEWGLAGALLFAGAPIAAEILFEAQHWHTHRQMLRARGLLAQPLPRLGALSWAFFGRRSKNVIKSVVEARLDVIEVTAGGQVEVARAELSGRPGMPGQVPAKLPGQPGSVSGARPGEVGSVQTLRLEVASVPGDARPSAAYLTPARAPRPATLPEPVLAARAPDGHDDFDGQSQAVPSIAAAVRTAIDEVGTDVDAVTARALEIKPDAQRHSVRREARRATGQLPGTGLYM